ncbi:MAG TPA: MSMEG_4193 family putative phosphomutase [Acidimicrobiales bacterium]|nr:MSMEG_4193 family putative phosphomutase [Acidimicrobiales bacterium]
MARPTQPKATRVLFVRHGATPTTGAVLPGRAPGLHLADQGRAQAEATAGRIGGLKGVAAVYASPLERTQETAAPIGRALGLRVKVDKGLLEADFGDWTGAKLADLRKRSEWKAVQGHPSAFRFPGGESFAEMQGRVVGATRRLCAAHPGATIVLVSHADPIKAALNEALGAHLDAFQRIVVSPCSVSAVAYGPTSTVVLAVNTTEGDLGALVAS